MKHFQRHSFLLAIILCITCFFCACTNNDDTKFVCSFSDELNGYIVLGCSNNSGKVLNFPSEYEGQPVVGISGRGFDGGNVYQNTTEINIPASIISISATFRNLTSLSKITVAEGNPIYHSNNNCLIETATNTLIKGCKTSEIPDYVTTIREFAFSFSSLPEITIPERVSSIGAGAFVGCSKISVAKSNPYYHMVENTLIETETNTLLWGGDNCIIPDGITTVATNAIFGTNLTELAIPNTVTFIDEMAFCNLPNLTKITVEEGNSTYHSIGNCLIETETDTLLFGCKSSIIPDGVTTIAACAFSGCETLTSLSIPVSVTKIESSAFDGCYHLTELYYQGTSAQWSEVKQSLLNKIDDFGLILDSCYVSVVHCTDGDITKEST